MTDQYQDGDPAVAADVLVFDVNGERAGHQAADVEEAQAALVLLVLGCQIRSTDLPPVHDPVPRAVWRTGIDLNPLDPAISADRQWLRALIWPDHTDRAARLDAALDVAARHPVTVQRGDATESLPALVDRAPTDAALVIYHSAVLAHMIPGDRERFTAALPRCSRHRPIFWIQAEPRPDNDPRRLRLTVCADGKAREDHPLGHYQPHGQWLDWTAMTQLSR